MLEEESSIDEKRSATGLWSFRDRLAAFTNAAAIIRRTFGRRPRIRLQSRLHRRVRIRLQIRFQCRLEIRRFVISSHPRPHAYLKRRAITNYTFVGGYSGGELDSRMKMPAAISIRLVLHRFRIRPEIRRGVISSPPRQDTDLSHSHGVAATCSSITNYAPTSGATAARTWISHMHMPVTISAVVPNPDG